MIKTEEKKNIDMPHVIVKAKKEEEEKKNVPLSKVELLIILLPYVLS